MTSTKVVVYGIPSNERFDALAVLSKNLPESETSSFKEFSDYGSSLFFVSTTLCLIQFVHKDSRHCWGQGWVGCKLEDGTLLSKEDEELYKQALGNSCKYLEVEVNE